jgi:enoyl-CoA hydratase/carnithine racemase
MAADTELNPDRLGEAGLRLDLEGPLAVVTLDRPDRRNAQVPATWRALADLGRALPEHVRVVLLRAEGPSFCAGLDRRMWTADGVPGEPSFLAMSAMPSDELDVTIAAAQEAFRWWRRPDRVTVAAVQGHAVGAGFQLALACDLRLLADDAALSMKEATLGLVPDLGGTKPLVEAVGYPRALEICVTGRWVHAEEAARIGLASAVVPRAELDSAARDLVAAILSVPAAAAAETKALLVAAADRTYDDQRAAERAAQARRLVDLASSLEA